MEHTTPNSAATEHADVDNTEPRESDATERAPRLIDVPLVIRTPSFDAETCDIKIGPCKLCCMCHETEILVTMQVEIQRRFRVPVSLGQLLQRYQNTTCDAGWNPPMPNKTWTVTIEAISRGIAAFQKLADATEHSACQRTANKTCDYAIALAHKTPADCPREDLLALLHRFMENRTYNVAFTDLINQVFSGELGGGSLVSDWPKKWQCLQIIERCTDAIRNQADQLRRQMDAYRPP